MDSNYNTTSVDAYANSLNKIPVRIGGKLIGYYVISEMPNDVRVVVKGKGQEVNTSAN